MTKSLRVFHLIKGLGRGGAEMLLSEGLRYADRTRVTYGYGYFLPWKDALVPSLRSQQAEVACFAARNPAEMLLSTPRVALFLRRWHADLIHCHLPLAGVIGRLVGQLLKLPVVYTEHNLMPRYHSWTRRVNLWTWHLQNRAVAVSQEVATSIHEYAGNGVPVQVIHNGVPVDTLLLNRADRVRVRQENGIPACAPVVGTVAVFRPQKNFPNWLRAAQLLKRISPDTHFLLVGDGLLRGELQAMAEALGLGECIHFVGLQEQVLPFLSAMDVYMMSSDFEGLPLALLEAMAVQLPTVVTAVGGIPEVVIDGKTGFLVEPRNPVALAKAVAPLLHDSQRREELGARGRKQVEERFSMRRMARELEELYLDVFCGVL